MWMKYRRARSSEESLLRRKLRNKSLVRKGGLELEALCGRPSPQPKS
jgi:hypothetical protein